MSSVDGIVVCRDVSSDNGGDETAASRVEGTDGSCDGSDGRGGGGRWLC